MSFSIGIDLGTTNSTLSTVSLLEENAKVEQISIRQENEKGEFILSHLPSFLFFPLSQESSKDFIVGEYARKRGSELPKRLISSAKSWLSCQTGLNQEKFLPLENDEDNILKMSPIEVSSAFLRELRASWEKAHPSFVFNEQKILVTVPASFDPAARELVKEAAQRIGYPSITLMEEPLAAFYAWLHDHEHTWRDVLSIGDRVLVIDIGGGTTDFTWIEVEEHLGELSLKRAAVGSHLLLGGDNIDLALAYFIQDKFKKAGNTLDKWQFQNLILEAKEAKEKFLAVDPPFQLPITIQSKGSRLIAQTLTITLEQQEVEQFLLKGFFPKLPFDEKILEEKKSGISTFALPFAKDPRITAHLAVFLQKNCNGYYPTKVLFNGGTLKSFAFQKQILSVLNEWASCKEGSSIVALERADLDFAVSKGAAFYGWCKEKKGIRVRAGASKSYFIGIEQGGPAVPGMDSSLQAICIAPLGMEEGEKSCLDKSFSLLVGEPAVFSFFSSSSLHIEDLTLQVGSIIENVDSLTKLHPIETQLDSQGIDERRVVIKIETEITEMGVLELWCVSEDQRRWKLEFNIRT